MRWAMERRLCLNELIIRKDRERMKCMETEATSSTDRRLRQDARYDLER
jgi:hypothetical protein